MKEPRRQRGRPAIDPADVPGLSEVRLSLLSWHRTLLMAGRIDYERERGRIEGLSQFLQLAMEDPAFAWIRNVSDLIVRLDEAADDGDLPSLSSALGGIRDLLDPDSPNRGFVDRYRDFLQRHPDVVMSHGALAGAIRKLAASERRTDGA